MAVVERIFAIDEQVIEQLDRMIDFNEQSKYVNQLFSSLIEQKNRENIEKIIWQFHQEMPNKTEKTSTDLLREMRDANYA